MSITPEEMVRPEVYADALAIIAELEAMIADLERDKTAAVELARRWRERCAAAALPADPILAGLLEQARRGAVPTGLYLRDWERLAGVELVEWREGAYWLTPRGEEVWRG